MTRKPNRSAWSSSVNAPSRRGPGAGSSRTDSRSLSPLSRGRQTPPLPEGPSRPVPYKQALVLAMTYCVGCPVSVQTRNGDWFEGILHTPGLVQSQVHFVLRKAKKSKPDEGTGDLIERLVIPSSELLQVCAKDLPVAVNMQPQQEAMTRPTSSPILAFPVHDDTGPFKYRFGDFDDLAFIGDNGRERVGAGLFGRELQKWEPDDGGVALEFDDSGHQVGTWDQFAENERKFGVTTDFNMDLYTTPLKPEQSRYTLAQADKIARDIQSASSPNLHIQDERNQLPLDDSGISDEILYSSVLKGADPVQKLESNGEMMMPATTTAMTPKAAAARKAEGAPEQGSGELEEKSSQSPPKSPLTATTHVTAKRPLILSAHNSSGPMIITNTRQNKFDVQGEFIKVARGVASLKPVPYGSPLKSSPLLQDSDSFEALNLQLTSGRKVWQQEDREKFLRFKAEAAAAKKAHVGQKSGGSKEEEFAKLRQFKEKDKTATPTIINRKHSGGGRSDSGSLLFVKSPSGGSEKTPVATTPLPLELDSGFGSQIIRPEDLPAEPEDDLLGGGDDDRDVLAQKGLPSVKTRREEGDECEFGDDLDGDNTGRGLNPHAPPFNPSQVQAFNSKSDSGCPTPGRTNSNSIPEDISPQESPVAPPESPARIETTTAVFNPENFEEFPPLPTEPVPNEVVMTPLPPPPQPQPTVLIRSQPPPHQPRVVTPPPPPPPPPHPVVATELHQQPMVVSIAPRPQHRTPPNKPSPSSAACHTPHNPMHQDQHQTMIMSSPHPRMPVSQAGQPPSQSSGPPLPSNGPPPQPMPPPPHMPPHMSGPMHVMPPQMSPYMYPSEMGGRMPMVYPYGQPVAPVPGPPAPPGQPNNPNSEQSMPHPSMVYHPYYAGIPSFPVPYHVPMMPQSQMPHYVPMAPAPMTPQGPGSTPRPRPRRKQGTFFNYGPRRN